MLGRMQDYFSSGSTIPKEKMAFIWALGSNLLFFFIYLYPKLDPKIQGFPYKIRAHKSAHFLQRTFPIKCSFYCASF